MIFPSGQTAMSTTTLNRQACEDSFNPPLDKEVQLNFYFPLTAQEKKISNGLPARIRYSPTLEGKYGRRHAK